MKKLFTTLLITCAISSAYAADTTPKNIIMVVGDGMGIEYITAYRNFVDNPKTPEVEKTIFDRHLIGLSSTYPAPISGYVTDSSAAATALSTGIKTYNDAVGIDANKVVLETVLERAKKLGLKTGAVVTSQVNHATPASYIVHNEFRYNYKAIADSFIDDKINNQLKYDVLFGGGWKYFIRKDRHIVNEFKALGAQYIDNVSQLSTLTNQSPAIGLFDYVGLPWAIDDANRHRLSTMVKSAIPLLENDKGFFLLVEGSRIDWAGHSNDIAAAMYEVDDLAKTMEYLETYVKANPDTVVILTADHSTGGFSIGRKKEYMWDPTVLRTMKHSPQFIAETLNKTDINIETVSDLLNFPVTKSDIKKILKYKKESVEEVNAYNNLSEKEKSEYTERPPTIEGGIEKGIKKIIDVKTGTGWTTKGHTGGDVPVIAFGAQHQELSGHIDNTDIAKFIFSVLDKK